jgi:hypothetical protein
MMNQAGQSALETPTQAMIEAGKRVLDRSGILENGIYRVHVSDAVIKSIFMAMMAAQEGSSQTE